jgi:acyl-CoA thioester hydrolase
VREPLVTYRGSVYPHQVDQMSHMNVQWYVEKFDQATWQLLNAIGLSKSRIQSERIGMAGVDQHIEYKRELFPGDVVTVSTTMLEVRDKVLRFVHEMTNDETGEVVARCTLVAVHIDLTTRKGRALPADVRERSVSMVEGRP